MKILVNQTKTILKIHQKIAIMILNKTFNNKKAHYKINKKFKAHKSSHNSIKPIKINIFKFQAKFLINITQYKATLKSSNNKISKITPRK